MGRPKKTIEWSMRMDILKKERDASWTEFCILRDGIVGAMTRANPEEIDNPIVREYQEKRDAVGRRYRQMSEEIRKLSLKGPG